MITDKVILLCRTEIRLGEVLFFFPNTDGSNFYEKTFCWMTSRSEENIGMETDLGKYTPECTHLVLCQSRKFESLTT